MQKIIGWLLRLLIIAIFLIGIVILFTPSLINLEMVKKSIKESISENVGGQISYRHLKLSYFPRPHVVIQKAAIAIPDSFTINIQWLKLYPKILPLFKGDLEIALVKLDYADYSMQLPKIEGAADEQAPSFAEMIGALTKAVRGLPEFKLPDMNLQIKNGRVNLVDPFGHKFKLRELQAAYVRSQDKLEFSIKCKSNLWEQINIKGSIDPSDFKGLGKIQLSRFRPQTLIAYLYPGSAFEVTETRANVTIDFTSDGAGSVKADVKGTLPVLEFNYGQEKLIVKKTRIKGTLAIHENMFRATITELGIEDPELNLTGEFAYDERRQNIQISLNGSQIDAASIRQAALKLAGRSEVIQILFNVIRGGHVPWITIQLRGKTIADFGNMDNIVIKGRMTRGKIFIPGAELPLTDVFGDALIAEGILHGKALRARLGNSHGQNGTLALGLNGRLDPFELNIAVNANLSQVPPVLKRVIPHEGFKDELARVEDVQGSASGILTLGGNLVNLGARVEISGAKLTAHYNRIPYPIFLEGGSFIYEGSRIAMQNFKAGIGKSTLAQLSANFEWTESPTFEANSQTAAIDIGQLYSWLKSFDTIKTEELNIRSMSGAIAARRFNMKGPLFSPQKWYFQTKGTIKNVIIRSANLSEEVLITQGDFSWRGAQIKFDKLDARLGKSSLTAVSGKANWKKKPMISARSGRSLLFTEDFMPLFFADKRYPKALKRLMPLDGKLALKDLTYSGPISGVPQRQLDLSAVIDQFSLRSIKLPGPLQVSRGHLAWRQNQLHLKDIDAQLGKSQISQFSATIDMKGKQTFMLMCQSANLFVAEIDPLLAAFGDRPSNFDRFSATAGTLVLSEVDLKGPIEAPGDWHGGLKARIQNMVVNSAALGNPLTIENGRLNITSEIAGNPSLKKIDVRSINLKWGKSQLTLTGQMHLSINDLLLDMNVNAADLAWDQIDTLIEYIAKSKPQGARPNAPNKLRGAVKVTSNRFIWDSYTVRPLEAEITFKPDMVVVAVNRADICGISWRGLLKLSDQTMDLYFVPTALNQKLKPTLSCLTAKTDLATGTYSLSGEILAKSKPDAITSSLRGRLNFSAEEGRIYRFGLLAKLLSILNVTEIYRGEVPDLTGEGFAYHSMSSSAKLQGGKIVLEECSIDGTAMGIACEGDIDLVAKKINLLILVAPFKTVDRIVQILPLIGNVLGGKLISIPFKAKGNLSDPDVVPLPPTAVGSGILGILERTLKLPITIIQPVISGVKGVEAKPSGAPAESPR